MMLLLPYFCALLDVWRSISMTLTEGATLKHAVLPSSFRATPFQHSSVSVFQLSARTDGLLRDTHSREYRSTDCEWLSDGGENGDGLSCLPVSQSVWRGDCGCARGRRPTKQAGGQPGVPKSDQTKSGMNSRFDKSAHFNLKDQIFQNLQLELS